MPSPALALPLWGIGTAAMFPVVRHLAKKAGDQARAGELDAVMTNKAIESDVESALAQSIVSERGQYGPVQNRMGIMEGLLSVMGGGPQPTRLGEPKSMGDAVAQNLGFEDVEDLMRETQPEPDPLLMRVMKRKGPKHGR